MVAAERTEFLGEVLKIAGANVGGLGMTMIDVRVKSIELPEEVSESVFNRMRQDFARQAAQLRAEGSAVAEQTRAEADRQRTEILGERVSATPRRSRARATRPRRTSTRRPSRATPISMPSIARLPPTASSLAKQGDILVLAPDGEFFKYLKESGR